MKKTCRNVSCNVEFESDDVMKVYCTKRCSSNQRSKEWYWRKRNGAGPKISEHFRSFRVDGINGIPVVHPDPIYSSYKMDDVLPKIFSDKIRIDKETGCYVWISNKFADEYGCFGSLRAHRVVWEFYHGPIAPKLVMDHMCKNRLCVNIEHLRLVTNAINITENHGGFSAKFKVRTHCKNGHEYNAENSYVDVKWGGRRCRVCNRIRQANLFKSNILVRQVVR